MSVVPFPDMPGRSLATIEIIRTPNGEIGARLIDMSIAEIESRNTVRDRLEAVVEWLTPAAASLRSQADAFDEDAQP